MKKLTSGIIWYVLKTNVSSRKVIIMFSNSYFLHICLTQMINLFKLYGMMTIWRTWRRKITFEIFALSTP